MQNDINNLKLGDFLKKEENQETYNIVGLESFETYLKICKHFSNWALDDISLANRCDAYKVWICPVNADKQLEVKSIIERYTSMKLLLKYYNNNIIENEKITFYIKMDFIQNKWVIDYGITNYKKMYKVGEFDYTINTKLPEEIDLLKYINKDLEDFNPREHLLMFKIKKDFLMFNPGYCQIYDPCIIDNKIYLSTYNLGVWEYNVNNQKKLQNGQLEHYMGIFKEWVKTQKWWNLVELKVTTNNNGIDFILYLKK